MRLVEILTAEAPETIHWLEESGVEFTRENGGYRIARCGGASRKRLLQVGDRTGHAITKALRKIIEGSTAETFPHSPLTDLEPDELGLAGTLRRARHRGWRRRFSPQEGAASERPRSVASSRPTIPVRPAR